MTPRPRASAKFMPSDSLPPMTERRRPPLPAEMACAYWMNTSSMPVIVLDSQKMGLMSSKRSQKLFDPSLLFVCQRRITWSR